ncbi:uncharacterized protein CANTADRAFT_26292 [Suhomyces tanzawaensis NRRL Y-17324]|uniref:Amino acid permease/ SLC12A domain-containing protein n=1 Tax=Suhomyces tanzawaensis NRRL Y-17324 TaxID=984487 RepID=A0A1E4SIS4_9ASCO|nr:uncharacterized protein CANTADRAFT_26292 [Suhomyces tanzawaensis NRRL Y-17324]ODV79332.1 hypothetical protein CANTADRAFT_26292 [Suhomyces tanzawaensis NRRL Y-17324]
MSYPTETSTLLPKDRRRKPKKNDPSAKLGTFEGVFLPTALNVLSILMFLRFGFIIGQMGILGTFFLLVLSYAINILTTMSISAISTNGTVKGGGAYYMISRSLGPEFGGAIGIIFFIGQILNSSLNVVGFIEPLLVNFGLNDGEVVSLLPMGYWWDFLYSSTLLAICTGVALVGSKLVSKTAFFLFIVLTLSTISIPISTLFVGPFYPLPYPHNDLWYSGLSWTTFTENLWPSFTSGAAGSVQPPGQPETFRNLFGIFFPATAGIFAGASMSGELRSPSKSIPEGTLKGLFITFILYSLVIISMGSSVPRELLHTDIKIIQTVNLLGIIVILGEFSTSLFSVIMGIVGAASMLNAIADDRIIPGLSIFTTLKKSKEAKYKAQVASIALTWFIAQVFLFADINQIATFITMAFLMTFIVTNIACFLLRVGSAPNFRPSFKYFSSKTAFTGALMCLGAMFIVDGISASLVIVFLMLLILMIHYTTPPSKFGDISQLLIYHQVRKYLLRLKLNMGVKYWRPQILLLCDDPRTSWNLIGFCNHLKKGGLYIIGHVVLMNDDTDASGNNAVNKSFSADSYKEIRDQKQAWIKLRDISKSKAFVQIALGPTLPWGVRNIYLGSGLGGMRPNITVLGFYDFVKHGVALPSLESANLKLPTDNCRKERKVSINQWVQIVEDLIILQATVAVAANFGGMKLPKSDGKPKFWQKFGSFWEDDVTGVRKDNSKKKYIDLYPIQMCSINQMDDGKSVLSTNFDTYTLILQLGAILVTVPEWKFNSHELRIIVFVETSHEIEEERKRLQTLLSSLRIDAEIKIVNLDDGNLASYNFLVKGYSKTSMNKEVFEKIDLTLKDDQWWKNLCNARETLKELEKQRLRRQQIKQTKSQLRLHDSASKLDRTKFSPLNLNSSSPPPLPLSASLSNRRYTISNLHQQGLSLSLNMNTQNADQYFNYNNTIESSDSSDSEKEYNYESDASISNYLTQDSDKRSTNSKKIGSSGQLEGTPINSSLNSSPLQLAGSKTPMDKSVGNSPTLAPSGSQTPKITSTNKFNELRHNRFAGLDNETFNKRFGSTDQLSIRSSRSNLRPNFLSVKIPESQINDEEDEEGGEDENKPSIQFVDDEDAEGEDDEEDDEAPDENEGEQGEEERKNQSSKEKEKEKDPFDANFAKADEKLPSRGSSRRTSRSNSRKPSKRAPLLSPSIITNDDEIIHHLKTPQFLAVEDDDESDDETGLTFSKRESSLKSPFTLASGPANSRSEFYKKKKPVEPKIEEKSITQKQLQEELKNLSFNDIPAKGQHLILNELMRRNSPKDSTAVIFSTLPAPSIGTHLDDKDSFDYTNNLAIWLDDLQPMMLLNSQTVTVTTSL